jgi:PAS domain S-box-containing protein
VRGTEKKGATRTTKTTTDKSRQRSVRDSKNLTNGEGEAAGSTKARKARSGNTMKRQHAPETEQLYALLAENISDVIFTSDMNLGLTYISPSVTRLLGMSVSEAVSRNMTEALTKQSLGRALAALEALDKKTGATGDRLASHTEELEMVCKDGSTVWVEARVNLLRDSSGAPAGLLGVLRDIGERKQAEQALRESEEKYRELVENLNAVVYTSNLEGNINYISPVFQFLYGRDPASFQGRSFVNFIHPADLPRVADSWANVITGQSESIEFRLVLEWSEEVRWVRSYNRPIIQDDRVTGVQGFLVDITNQKLAEEALRSNEERFRKIYEKSPLGIVSYDAQGKITGMNKAALDIFGLEDVSQASAPVLADDPSMPPEARRRLRMGKSLVYEGPFDFTEATKKSHYGTTKSGTAYLNVILTSLGPTSEGSPAGYFLLVEDITRRKATEEALKESETRYRLVAENVWDVIFTADLTLKLTFVTPSIERSLGYTVEEMLTKTAADILTPSSLEVGLQLYSEAMATVNTDPSATSRSTRLELEVRRKDGSPLWVDLRLSFLTDNYGQPVAILGVARDITQRRMAEEALRQSEEQYRHFVENVDAAFYSVDRQGCLTYLSPVFELIYGQPPSDLVGKKFADFLHPDDLPSSLDKFEKAMSGRLEEPWECRMVLPGSKKIFWVQGHNRVIREGDTIIGMQGILVNISDRKAGEVALRESEEKYRTLVESSPDGIVSVDPDGFVVDCNEAACRVLGHNRNSLIGLPARRLLSERALETVPGYREQLMTIGLFEDEFEFVGEDGETRIIWAKAVKPDVGTSGLRSLVYLRDVSERRRVAELKDEFIGLVSHELRSPLTVIIGAVNTALSESDRLSRQEMRQLLKDAADEAESLSHLLGNLLELSRAQANRLLLHLEQVHLHQIAHDAMDKVKQQSGTHRIIIDLPKRLPLVEADQLRLERILFNLLENAVKYSPGGGDIRLFARRQGHELIVGVRDNGVGISPEDRVKLFQPFQRLGDPRDNRTKGAGLGLLVCRRLVEAHGGRIWVESEVNRGTTFYFTLPVRQRRRASK